MAEVTAWQSPPAGTDYPVVFFDALRVKIRDDAVVRNKAVYLALGVLPDGTRDVLGNWIEQTEGAKFWLKVFNELHSRGVGDILIAVVDGLKGMSEALAAVFPATTLQTCIVHLIRNSLDFANWKERKPLAAALRADLHGRRAPTRRRRRPRRVRARSVGREISTVVAAWRRAWAHVIPFFAFPPTSGVCCTRRTRWRACTRSCERSSPRAADYWLTNSMRVQDTARFGMALSNSTSAPVDNDASVAPSSGMRPTVAYSFEPGHSFEALTTRSPADPAEAQPPSTISERGYVHHIQTLSHRL